MKLEKKKFNGKFLKWMCLISKANSVEENFLKGVINKRGTGRNFPNKIKLSNIHKETFFIIQNGKRVNIEKK